MNKQQLLQSLRKQGISEEILIAFSKVKREDFVDKEFKEQAYEDDALPIGYGQTISQPYTIALMLSNLELKKGQKVLEVGSGSGYVLALLAEIVGEQGEVFGIERIKELAQNSKQNLKGYGHVKIYSGNGADGLPDYAGFDRILISAGCREMPEELFSQLKEMGIIVLPLGPYSEKALVVIQKINGRQNVIDRKPGFMFVNFIE